MASELFASISRDHALRRNRIRSLAASPEKELPELLEGDVVMFRDVKPPFAWRPAIVIGATAADGRTLVQPVPVRSNADEPSMAVLSGRIRIPGKFDIVHLSDDQKSWLRARMAHYPTLYPMAAA